MPHVELNGIRLYYEADEENGRPPLLLLAGLGANRMRWTPALPLLREHFRYDNRGTGRSDVPEGPYPIDQLGDDAAALIEHLGLGPLDCMGWSLGGSVLQSLLIRHPEALKRAVLVSAFPSYTRLQHAWLDALIALRRADVGDVARAVIGMPWGATARGLMNHERAFEAAELASKAPEQTSLEGFLAQAEGLRVYDSRPDLHQVRTPTTVLVGAEDILTPPSQSIEIAERIPGARLVVLPRGSHSMMLEYTPDVVAAVKAFLD
jgi:pimeloyl-ACP methyl ester carboxylesterase